MQHKNIYIFFPFVSGGLIFICFTSFPTFASHKVFAPALSETIGGLTYSPRDLYCRGVSGKDNGCQIIKYPLRSIALMASIVRHNPVTRDFVISCKSHMSSGHMNFLQ